MTFVCTSCGKEHDLADISFGASAPYPWEMLSDQERSQSELGEEQCVIETRDGKHYFIRACLEIPIIGKETVFSWGVWCSLSEKSFAEVSAHWDDPGRTEIGPHFGWLCTRVPEYPDTLSMKTHVHQREVGLRPLVELDESDHPLSVHQRYGIQEQQLQQIVMRVLHNSASAS